MPTLGIHNEVPGTELNPRALVNTSNMQVENGVLAQRYGYPTYGTNTNLVGTPYLFFPFTSFAGVTTLYCATSNGVYYLGDDGAWQESIAITDFVTTYKYPSMCTIENKMLATSSEKGIYSISVNNFGPGATDRATIHMPGMTVVDKDSAAIASGKVTHVEIWSNTDLAGVKIAVFNVVAGNNLTARSVCTIGAVTAGSKQEIGRASCRERV